MTAKTVVRFLITALEKINLAPGDKVCYTMGIQTEMELR